LTTFIVVISSSITCISNRIILLLLLLIPDVDVYMLGPLYITAARYLPLLSLAIDPHDADGAVVNDKEVPPF